MAARAAGRVRRHRDLLATEHGAEEVAVVDADPRRLAVARRLGLLALADEDHPSLTLKTRWRHGPGDHGADVVFQCRRRPHALATALRAVRRRGR